MLAAGRNNGCKRSRRSSRPLVGSFEENILNNRLEPTRIVDGYTCEVRASSSRHQPTPLKSCVRVSFFAMGDSSFPYLGQVPLGRRGYQIPKQGTLQVTLFNPHGTLVKLFLLMYNLTDMPANSQTFLRQKTMLVPSTSGTDSEGAPSAAPSKCCSQNILGARSQVHYLIQCNIVTSKSGRIYLNKDVRIFIARKVDIEAASQLESNQHYELRAFDEMPANPRYFER